MTDSEVYLCFIYYTYAHTHIHTYFTPIYTVQLVQQVVCIARVSKLSRETRLVRKIKKRQYGGQYTGSEVLSPGLKHVDLNQNEEVFTTD